MDLGGFACASDMQVQKKISIIIDSTREKAVKQAKGQGFFFSQNFILSYISFSYFLGTLEDGIPEFIDVASFSYASIIVFKSR